MEVNSVQQQWLRQLVVIRTATAHVRRVVVSFYNHMSPVNTHSALYHFRCGNGYPITSVAMRLKSLDISHTRRQEFHAQKSIKSFHLQGGCTNPLPSSLINTMKFLDCRMDYQRCHHHMSCLSLSGTMSSPQQSLHIGLVVVSSYRLSRLLLRHTMLRIMNYSLGIQHAWPQGAARLRFPARIFFLPN